MVGGYYSYAQSIPRHVGIFSDEFEQARWDPACTKSTFTTLGMKSIRNDSSMVRGYYNYACTISNHVGMFSNEFWQPNMILIAPKAYFPC